jgi:hypothetical protein
VACSCSSVFPGVAGWCRAGSQHASRLTEYDQQDQHKHPTLGTHQLPVDAFD